MVCILYCQLASGTPLKIKLVPQPTHLFMVISIHTLTRTCARQIATPLHKHKVMSHAVIKTSPPLWAAWGVHSVFGPSRMEQCNEILRTAEQYEDIHLLAMANGIKAILMKQQG